MRTLHRTLSALIAAACLTGCAEYIIAEAAVNAVYHGSKALSEYSNPSSKSSVTQSTMIACAFPDGKIYMQTKTQCRSNNGLIVDTDGKTKFGCRSSDGELFAATYNSCLARKGWIDNTITVECSFNSGSKQQKTAFECLSIGYNVIGVPKTNIVKDERSSETPKSTKTEKEGKCELAGSGYILVTKSVCNELSGKWVL